MKTYQILIILVQLVLLSCHKDEDLCLKTAFFNSGIETLSKSELATAESLFNKNNLNYTNKQFTTLSENDADIIVNCYQYINGLKVFTEPLKYFFRKSSPQSLDFVLGDTLLQGSIDPSDSSLMKSDTVFAVYKSRIMADEAIHWNSSLCYVIEFGYYDLNVSTNQEPVFVPAWKVEPEGEYTPVAYINDLTGEVIYYFNGIYY